MFILGDVHANADFMNSFLESNEKYCIQLGDFGFIWNYGDWKWNKFLNKFEKEYSDKIIFVVPGNHENYDSFMKLPQVEVFGAKAYKVRENVFYIKRGEILEIENTTFLCIGGADSTDKAWRIVEYETKGIKCWWGQEAIHQKDIDNALKNLEKYGGRVDYVCSHAEPRWAINEIMPWAQESQSENLLGDLSRQVECEIWFGGHIHESLEVKGRDFDVMTLGEGCFCCV